MITLNLNERAEIFSIRGECKAKEFKAQFEKLKNYLEVRQ